MVTIQNGHLTVDIAAQGAEMQRVRDANGVERLWHGDPAFWSGRAPVLFPVAGAFKEDTYILDGKRYTMPKHGFAKEREFALEHQDAASATFVLAREAGQEPGFPFAFALRIRYLLDGNAITVQYITENTGREAFWHGIGAHEAYACPEGIGNYRVVFEKEEALRRILPQHGQITRESTPLDQQGNVLPLADVLFAEEAIIFDGIASRSVTLESPLHNRTVRVDFPDFDALLLWTIPGAPYLCIEPWTNLPDYADTDQDITKKPGMFEIRPGESRMWTHVVTFGG